MLTKIKKLLFKIEKWVFNNLEGYEEYEAQIEYEKYMGTAKRHERELESEG